MLVSRVRQQNFFNAPILAIQNLLQKLHYFTTDLQQNFYFYKFTTTIRRLTTHILHHGRSMLVVGTSIFLIIKNFQIDYVPGPN